MRRRQFLALLPGFAFVGGCGLSRTATATKKPWYDPFEVFGASPDAVVLMTSLLDRPGGDPYLTDGPWSSADKPVPHETAAPPSGAGNPHGGVDGIPTA